jgi:amidase
VTRNPWDLQRTSGGSSGGSATAVAAGLASAALGSDGAGSIRIPAACCHLFGLKPQRGRVPTAPAIEPARGLAVYGPLTRTVEDAARVMDAITDGGPSLAEAATQPPGKLRIAISVAIPPGVVATLDAEQHGAVETIATTLRELGHAVEERELDYDLAFGNRVLARFVRAIGDKAQEVGHPERLSRRARGLARIGSSIPSRLSDAAGRQAAADSERLNRIFEHADVVLTPLFTRRPPRVREYENRSGLTTLVGMVRLAPYAGGMNHTGQPAVSVPAGFTPDGFPLGAQLIGPPDSEALLVQLSAQLQQARHWEDHRPAVAA